jgi:microsomal epoxide hydrolase
MRFWLSTLFLLTLALPARAKDFYFTASDGARLHYTESGPPGAPFLVFVPGWTMPGWIFTPQLNAFSKKYQVVLFDPRGQGASEITATGYNQDRRGRDLGELVDILPGKVVVIGWSLGVLDALAWIHQGGSDKLAGLVLIDNSVGENPAPTPPTTQVRPVPPAHNRSEKMMNFVSGMFRICPARDYLNRLTASCLRLPQAYADELRHYPVPRSYWKEAILSTDVPVFYAVRPHLAGQAHNLELDRPNTSIAIFPEAGHALFVDDATRFDGLMQQFLDNDVHL